MHTPIVLFDIDGTLTQSWEEDSHLFFGAIEEVFSISTFSKDLNGYADVTDSGIAFEICNRHLNREPCTAELAQLEDEYAARLNKAIGRTVQFSAMEGAIPFVHHLESMGVDVGIATGNFRKSAAVKLRALGFERLMSKAGTSTDANSRKDILHFASRLFPVSHARPKWYIGDGVWDVKSASALGFKFVGVGDKLKLHILDHWVEDFRNFELLAKTITNVRS
jgi:phosphoglycolate phosphatase-like HAD superfamily hydrolase